MAIVNYYIPVRTVTASFLAELLLLDPHTPGIVGESDILRTTVDTKNLESSILSSQRQSLT